MLEKAQVTYANRFLTLDGLSVTMNHLNFKKSCRQRYLFIYIIHFNKIKQRKVLDEMIEKVLFRVPFTVSLLVNLLS